MELKGKKVIIIGELEGITGPAIEACLRSAGAEPVLVLQVDCSAWTAIGALDLEGQERISELVEQRGKDNLIAIIGVPDAHSVKLYAETLVNGDPSWLGPLAGISLGLPVYHIMEPEIKGQIDPVIYRERLALLETTLDIVQITDGLKRVRKTE